MVYKVVPAEPAVSLGARRGGLGQGRDNACLLAVKDFLAAEITPVDDDMQFGCCHRVFGLYSHVGELVTVMANVGDFMGNDKVVLGVDGNVDVVTDHPTAPTAGRH
jgi:hypothetical protein